MAQILDRQGNQQEVKAELAWYAEASEKGISLEQLVNQTYATDTQYGSAYRQLLASEGIIIRPNKEFGLRSNTLKELMDATPDKSAGDIIRSSDFSSAALRTLFPSAVLTAIEDRLQTDYNMNANAFESMVAITESIAGDKFERPLLNYTNPTNARSQAISQLSEPAAILSITTSSVSRAIPALSLGMTISDQAKAATTLDLVSLALARQVSVERSLRVYEYLLQFLNGDPDTSTATLSSLGYSVNASALDAASTGGTLTQLAWMSWLYRNSTKRVIDWVVTDIKGAMKIENRTGKPTNVTDNPNSTRIDSILDVANPTWKSNVKVFITADPNWPANTIMGFDSRFAIHRVQSSTIAYQAVEQFVLRRAQSLRVDIGEIAYRLYDDAFDTLILA